MGLGDDRANRRQAACRQGDFRRAITQGSQIPGLCAGGLHLCCRGQEHPYRAQAGEGGSRRAAQARLHRADEPLPGKNRLPARPRPRRKQNADLLYDPGGRSASDLHPIYQQAGQVALRLPAIPGEPDTRRLWLSRLSNLVQGSRSRQVSFSLSSPAPFLLFPTHLFHGIVDEFAIIIRQMMSKESRLCGTQLVLGFVLWASSSGLSLSGSSLKKSCNGPTGNSARCCVGTKTATRQATYLD